MIDKCPACDEKIDILPTQEPTLQSTTSTTGTVDFTSTFYFPTSYPSTTKTYKCSNPKCWVTKIRESWE